MLVLLAILSCCASMADPVASRRDDGDGRPLRVELISTKVPFPRGFVLRDDKLYVLARGRSRESGGANVAFDDRAGAIFEIDTKVGAPFGGPIPSSVRDNGKLIAVPTDPPFHLLDRSLREALLDERTDRPYCSLRFHEPTHSFYLCAFSGIDKAEGGGGESFRKNFSDALLRYDLRTKSWHAVERHDLRSGWVYPHHDPRQNPPPHGWLKGPDNCLGVGRWLYAVAKDNSLLVRYDLRAIENDPHAGPPPSEFVLDENLEIRGLGTQQFHGHSMLAVRDGHLYIGYRTSSAIVRIPLDREGLPVRPIQGELLARFDPYDPKTRKSANLTDMDFDSRGRLYVISAMPSRVYRFTPDPKHVYDARENRATPWADMAKLTGNPKMKSENVLVDARDRVYLSAGDAYGGDAGLGGAIYRVTEAQSGR